MSVELPLFPLNTVLFPHTALALNIFEPRYQQLLADCRRDGTGFGVVAIAEGLEVGGVARPHPVGSLATLTSVEMLDDGRAAIALRGVTRFTVEALSYERPYLVGSVSWLSEETGELTGLTVLAGEVNRVFSRYSSGLNRLAGLPGKSLPSADDPERLAYMVAAAMQIDVAEKQRLLEAETTLARLRRCLQLLRRELVLLDRMLAPPDSRFSVVSPN